MARLPITPGVPAPQSPIIAEATANAAFMRYSALQKAWASCPSLEEDPRFAAMRDEAHAAFRRAFEVLG